MKLTQAEYREITNLIVNCRQTARQLQGTLLECKPEAEVDAACLADDIAYWTVVNWLFSRTEKD